MILDQKAVLEHGPAIAGAKAYALARAWASGVAVPEFFVVTPQYADENGKLSKQSCSRIEALCLRLAARDDDVFAVRSSARAEDSASASHAGQYLTRLNQKRHDIADAVEAVFASGMARNVSEYKKARGIKETELPAVIVQCQINAVSAGVAFSADPVSGRRDRVVISAIEGLAERLVSGEEDGEGWQVGKACQDIFLRPGKTALLDDAEVKAIAALCMAAEQRKKEPQDIEWAIDKDGKLWHLQDRPVTSRLLADTPYETELSVLDNSNIVESYPGLVSPLTFSFAAMAYERVYRTFLKMVGTPDAQIGNARSMLANMLVLCDGHMYYNLGNWYRLLSFLPFFSKNRSNMESMMGVSSPIPDEAVKNVVPLSRMAWLRATGFLMQKVLFFPFIRKNFYNRLQAALHEDAGTHTLDTMSLAELGGEYRRLEAALLDSWDAPILNDFLCMMAYGGSRKYLERYAGQAGLRFHNDVMIGQGDIISAEPARLICEAGRVLAAKGADFKKAVAQGEADKAFNDPQLGPKLHDYIARFGDRRIGELKLETSTLQDDPSALLAAVYAAALKHNEVPGNNHSETKNIEKIFAGGMVKKWIACLLLLYAKKRVKDRENLRFGRTRVFTRVRRICLSIGCRFAAIGKLEKADDIFFLELHEVLGAVEGFSASHDLMSLVHLRKAEQAENARRPDPGERVLIRGVIGDRGARIWSRPATTGGGKQDDKLRRGLACGTGRVTARVRVIRDPLSTQLQHGEVLVARNTDPGWISHFVNASAVVVERGSVLSHSAIVSRELGIPCVIGVRGACDWLRDGELVEVDGGEGIVRKYDA